MMSKDKNKSSVDSSSSPNSQEIQPTVVNQQQFRAITLSVMISALSDEFYEVFPEDGKGLRFKVKDYFKQTKQSLRSLLSEINQYASWQNQQQVDAWSDGIRPTIKLALRMSDEQLIRWLEMGEQFVNAENEQTTI